MYSRLFHMPHIALPAYLCLDDQREVKWFQKFYTSYVGTDMSGTDKCLVLKKRVLK